MALYQQRNAAGTVINRINAGGDSYFNGGNVGIGTTPSFKLDVNGTGNFNGTLYVTSGTTNAAIIKGDGAFDGATRFYLTNNAYIYGRNNLVLTGRLDNANDGYSFGTNSRSSIVFNINEGGAQGAVGTEYYGIQLQLVTKALYFQSKYGNDNALMGFLFSEDNQLRIRNTTSYGDYALQVTGNSYMSSTVNINNTTNTTYKFSTYNNVEDTHVLIAGLAPSVRFKDTVTSHTYSSLFGMATIANNFITGSAAGDFAITWESTKKCFFGYTNTTAIMVLDNGNLGLGTLTVGSKAQINGNMAVGYSASTAAPTNGILSNGGFKSSNPTGGTAQTWKLGSAYAGTISSNYYVNVEINGVSYSLLASNAV